MFKLALHIYLLVILFSSQTLRLQAQSDWNGQQLLIKKLALYKQSLLTTNSANVQILGQVINEWDSMNIHKDEQADILTLVSFALQKNSVLDTGMLIASHTHLYPKSKALKGLSGARWIAIGSCGDLLDLIHEEVLQIDYPFIIDKNSEVFEELNIYNPQSGEKIGEVGAGCGMFSLLLHLGTTDIVLETNEISDNLIDYILNKFKRADSLGNKNRVTIVTGKAKQTNFLTDKLDKVIIRESFHHFKYPRHMLESIKLSLKPGGLVHVKEIPKGTYAKGDSTCKRRLEVKKIVSIWEKNGFELVDQVLIGDSFIFTFESS